MMLRNLNEVHIGAKSFINLFLNLFHPHDFTRKLLNQSFTFLKISYEICANSNATS